MSDEIKEKTRRTAEILFRGVDTSEGGYALWRQFDKELAKQISMFYTGRKA